MRAANARLLIPVAVVVGLWVPAVQTATAASTPTPQRITGIVQTIIREQPPGQRTDANDTAANDTTKVLRVGTTIVPLTDDSLITTKDGATVSATVVPGSDGTMRVLSANTMSTPVAAAISSTHQVYLALVVPAGLTADASITEASARAMVTRVSQYWSSQTGDQVSFTTARVLAYHSAYRCTRTYEGTYKMWDEAQARMPEANGLGKHLVLVAPEGADGHNCYYGLGTIGAIETADNDVFVSGLNQSLLAHELGHNLGLYHSNSLRCSGTQDMPVVNLAFPGCQTNPYDDLFDVMGYSGTNYGEGNLNAVHLDGMGLLPSAVQKIPANSGVTQAWITPLSKTTDNRTLKIADPSGTRYFVEYRTNSGRDAAAGLTYFRPEWGVRVLRDDPLAPASAGSYELDATPTSLSSDYDRRIPVGGTFTAASRQMTIQVTSQDASGASVSIYDGVPLPRPLPSRVSLSIPARAWVGAAITAATRVTDEHGEAVANWTVTLQKMPRGTTTWRSVTSLRTTSTGAASYRFANGVTGYYRWVTSPVTGTPSKLSPSLAITSTARVIENRPATSMAHGRYLSVYGSVSSVPAPIVYIQYRYGSSPWRTGPRATVYRTAVSGRIAVNVPTTVYTRLYVRTATSYVGSISNYYVTAVR